MHKLVPVEEAKELFEEAKGWPVWRWLLEKKRARTTADAAWEALEEQQEKVKSGWAEEWRLAYRSLSNNGRSKPPKQDTPGAELQAALERLWAADQEAQEARDRAEAQFDEADRRLSTAMAREGSQMAIDAWELREKFIRKAEALARRK